MIYSWREADTGAQRISNVAPDWYRPDAEVVGPRVVVTLNRKVVDDTSWPLAKRLEAKERLEQRSAPRK
jgi:hypothetical protein